MAKTPAPQAALWFGFSGSQANRLRKDPAPLPPRAVAMPLGSLGKAFLFQMTHRSSCERALSKPTSPACLRWSPGFSLVEGATSPASESPGASGAAAPTCEPERTEAGLAPRTGLLWLQHGLSIGFSRFWRLKRLPTPGLESRPWEVLGPIWGRVPGSHLGVFPHVPPYHLSRAGRCCGSVCHPRGQRARPQGGV